ncbi:dihydrofolate reductase [Auraticoccus sp. F435]|uniref:Dihydrofolate reductase n=1 Tax=Auraticoccus cholistanensis TaxID=2656650 RepID=A0A6A9UVZ4_9ACTN|nr:dihydrofolate reductase family protein [Auraticoccus cholistanensis]MVA75744.1 dihydrofolate reductase [Auraticoccus cholistanensis]
MTRLVCDISVSLDGYVAGASRTAEAPLGAGGDRLHGGMASAEGQDLLAGTGAGLGAVIAGRRTYDDSVRWWGADGPSGPARRPTFVVTHAAPEDAPADAVYQFVTGGITDALQRARAAAGEDTVCVMGGASLIQQFLATGLVEELSLHVVPVLLGDGLRLFEGPASQQRELVPLTTTATPTALHVRYALTGPR